MAESRGWKALGTKPGAGNSAALLRVEGEVDLPNPGARAELARDRAGINPDIVMLRVVVTQGEGDFAQVITPARVVWEDEVHSSATDVEVIDLASLAIDWQ